LRVGDRGLPASIAGHSETNPGRAEQTGIAGIEGRSAGLKVGQGEGRLLQGNANLGQVTHVDLHRTADLFVSKGPDTEVVGADGKFVQPACGKPQRVELDLRLRRKGLHFQKAGDLLQFEVVGLVITGVLDPVVLAVVSLHLQGELVPPRLNIVEEQGSDPHVAIVQVHVGAAWIGLDLQTGIFRLLLLFRFEGGGIWIIVFVRILGGGSLGRIVEQCSLGRGAGQQTQEKK
jgi:hypothetical protein